MSTPEQPAGEGKGLSELNSAMTVDKFVPMFTSVPSNQRTPRFFKEREKVLVRGASAEIHDREAGRYIDALKDKLNETNSMITLLRQRGSRCFPLLQLPTFLLQMVAAKLDKLQDLTCLIRVSKALAETITPVLYRIARETRFDTKELGVLHEAASWGRIHVVKKLLQYGADIDGLNSQILNLQRKSDLQRNNRDGTPLHLALKHRKIEMVEFLLDRGASVHMVDESGNPPLLTAICQMKSSKEGSYLSQPGSYRIVELLLSHGADVNYQGIDGETPLHGLLQHNPTPRWLLAKMLNLGADPNVLNRDGLSPVHFAAAYHDFNCPLKHCYNVMPMLVRSGGNINQRFGPNHKNCTILQYLVHSSASNSGYFKWVEDMIEMGADLHAKDSDGRTALHLVASEELEDTRDMLETLVACGADRASTDNNGCTPLDLARVAQARIRSLAASVASDDELKWNYAYHNSIIDLLKGDELGPEKKLWKKCHGSN
jgi:ankyrin repeat protein